MRRRFFNISGEHFDYSNYMTIEALDDEVIITMPLYMEYGIDGNGWYSLPPREPIYVKKGKLVSFKGYQTPAQGLGRINVNGKFNLKGNCLSLAFGDNARDITSIESYGMIFQRLFEGNIGLIEVDKNFLPATTLADYCYHNMFSRCTSLVNAPELPAEILANSCYNGMFSSCIKLTTAPALPATTLAERCCISMFSNCTSLVNAPELPAEILANSCYNGMFNGCSKLNYIKMLATDISATSCLYNWVSGVASTGTFVKHADMATLPTGTSGIPSRWTVVNDGEESGGNLITFTIDGTEYQAEEGMTWGEWVDSEYNVNGRFIIIELDNSIGDGNTFGLYIGTEEDYVYATDIIQENCNYFIVG